MLLFSLHFFKNYLFTHLAVLGLSSSMCDLVPDQGSSPGLLHGEYGPQPLDHQEDPSFFVSSLPASQQQGDKVVSCMLAPTSCPRLGRG